MIDGEKTVSRAAAERDAEHDPVLASMIRKGVPLSRNAYLMLAWGADLPADWHAEHEMEVPECFRDPDAIKRDTRKKGHTNIIQD
jgi:hypothetical protein